MGDDFLDRVRDAAQELENFQDMLESCQRNTELAADAEPVAGVSIDDLAEGRLPNIFEVAASFIRRVRDDPEEPDPVQDAAVAYVEGSLERFVILAKHESSLTSLFRRMEFEHLEKFNDPDVFLSAQKCYLSEDFMRMMETFRDSGDIDCVEIIRQSFLDRVRSVCASGVTAPAKRSGSYAGFKGDDMDDVVLWTYLYDRGVKSDAFKTPDKLPPRLRDLYLLFHFQKLRYALEDVIQGELGSALKRVRTIESLNPGGVGRYFTAGFLDAISSRHDDYVGAAETAWRRVSEMITSVRMKEPEVELIKSGTSTRKVGAFGSTQVQKENLIVHKYRPDNEEQRQAADWDVAKSRFIATALKGTGIAPLEVALYECDSNLYYVEKRMPGRTFEQVMQSDPDYFSRVPDIVDTLSLFYMRVTDAYHTITKGSVLHECFKGDSLDTELAIKVVPRFERLFSRLGSGFPGSEFSDTMHHVLRLLKNEIEFIMHKDVRGANIIIPYAGPVALIDFDKASFGLPLLDYVGFIEHSEVEGRPLKRFTDLYDRIERGEMLTKGMPADYYRQSLPAAAVYQLPRLCVSVIKHHEDPDDWRTTGKYRALRYLSAAGQYAGTLGERAEGDLKLAAGTLQLMFRTMFSDILNLNLQKQ